MTKILVLFLFSSVAAYADSNELVLGSLTYHLLDGSEVTKLNTNKVDDDGKLVSNFIIGFQHNIEEANKYDSYSVFTGENSIGKPLVGAKWSTGITNRTVYLGVLLGGYFQNNDDFHDLGINNMASLPLGGSIGIVPLLGFEVNIKLIQAGHYYLKLNNILTPALTNHTLSLGVSF